MYVTGAGGKTSGSGATDAAIQSGALLQFTADDIMANSDLKILDQYCPILDSVLAHEQDQSAGG